MAQARTKKVALVYPGDRAARDSMCAENNRFAQVARALTAFGLATEPAVYHDHFADGVRRQLLDTDAALVCVAFTVFALIELWDERRESALLVPAGIATGFAFRRSTMVPTE